MLTAVEGQHGQVCEGDPFPGIARRHSHVAYAQASIVGTVKDASGAVLPGVTVEASSPALIEKTRSVVTGGTGQYSIENLRPGTYTVTFTLTGFPRPSAKASS